MTLQEKLNFMDAWIAGLALEGITSDTKISDVFEDSLDMLESIMKLEDSLDMNIPLPTNLVTFGQLTELLWSLVNEKTGNV